MNMPFDEDDLPSQAGLGSSLLAGGDGALTSGLGAALAQLALSTAQPPNFPPPVDPDIPGGAASFNRALAGLSMPQVQGVPSSGGRPDMMSVTPSDPVAASDGVAGSQADTQAQTLDLNKASEYLDAHTSRDGDGKPKSIRKSEGECASYVRQALAAGGVNLPVIHYAKDYGPALLKAGFTQLDAGPRTTYTPQQGDVIIYQPFLPKHKYGHMEMYDGKHWVSDFMQQGPVPFGNGTLPYAIYRP